MDWGLWSILPAVVAILVAFWSQQAILALVVGVWLGASMLAGSPWAGALRLIDEHIKGALADGDHAAIVVFTVMLGGLVGVVARTGGLAELIDRLAKRASTARSGQLATWLLGLVVFFDDYANCLLVGPTMRPLTDRLKISREKLSYIVDSTAAPVAVLAPLSTWVGYEIALIATAYKDLGLGGDVYLVFLKTIPYRFYAVFTLFLVGWLAWTGRDFGPMLAAERRARRHGKPLREGAKPMGADEPPARPEKPVGPWLGLAPIAVVILATIVGLYLDGTAKLGDKAPAAAMFEILGAASSLNVLLWASLLGCAAAVAIGVRPLGLARAMDAWLDGAKSMLMALVILTLAWALGGVSKQLGTAAAVADFAAGFPAAWLPTAVFVVSGGISFVTGTSWGTMAIVMPIAVPVSQPGGEAVMLATVGSVLAGATWGDHCSPISDTTILSSMGGACDHMDHVRTQMPYALAAGAVSILFGTLPAGYGLSPWVSLVLGCAALAALVRFVGRKD